MWAIEIKFAQNNFEEDLKFKVVCFKNISYW